MQIRGIAGRSLAKRILGIPALFLCSFLLEGCREPTIAFFKTMEIDPATLVVTFSNPLTEEQASSTQSYFRFRTARFYSVDHYARFAPSPRIRYNAFNGGFDSQLKYREKYQSLLTGAFGTVYAKSTYYYAPMYARQNAEFLTSAYANNIEHETPEIVTALPNAGVVLSSISVVRVFRAPPEFLIVSANYSGEGSIQAISVNAARNGDWVHSNDIPEPFRGLGVANMFGDRPEARSFYGLPAKFSPEAWRGENAMEFGATVLERELDAVTLHFNRNQWAQQYVFRPNQTTTHRLLHFQITQQDLALASRDDQGSFGVFR